MKKCFFHSIKLPFDAEIAEKILNVINSICSEQPYYRICLLKLFFVIFQSSEKGLKISSFASLSDKSSDNGNGTGLKIASVSGGDSPLKIASVSGSKEIVNLDAESSDSNQSSASKSSSSQQKKPVLKLASFAGWYYRHSSAYTVL